MQNSSTSIAIESPAFAKDRDLKSEPGYAHATIHFLQVSPLEKKMNLWMKRVFDIIFSSVVIVFLLSWIVPFIALLIKLNSQGPVFFLQKRAKKGSLLFTCIKFRTMVLNKEADTLASSANDCRITKIGKFLRAHHLDELPQLFNVWWGDMSLIGPRPHMVSDDKKFESLITQYPLRYKVKPGITGLAQSLGYAGPALSVDDMKERLKQDLYYISHWSVALDVRIVYHTFFRMIAGK